jgi:hypothetical protein
MDRAEMLVEMLWVMGLFVKNDEFAHAEYSFETGVRSTDAVDRFLL